MAFASKDPKPLTQEQINTILESIPPVTVDLTPEQINTIASQIPAVDMSGKVDKVTGSSLLPDLEAAKIHQPGSDNQDLSGKVDTNDVRLSDARTPVTHSHAPADVTGTAVITNDARLSDARTPLTHSHSYEPANANIQTHVGSTHAPSTAQANADITKGEIEAKLTGAITSHSHAGGSGSGTLRVDLAVPVLAALVWTNMPVALSFWLSTATVNKSGTKADLTNYTQVRLLVNKQGVAGAAASKLILRYKVSPWTQVVANYLDIGTSEVSVVVNVLNSFRETAWIPLAVGAKADVFISLLGSGGDGALDPAFGLIVAEFK